MILRLLICTLIPSLGFAALPPEARNLVDSLPDKAITMELVLSKGAQSSESFKEVKAQAALIPQAKMGARAPFTTQLTAGVTKTDDRTESAPPFGTDVALNDTYSIGISKQMATTGTKASVEYEHAFTSLTYPVTSGLTVPDYYESRLTLKLEQNLLKNSFGRSTRRELRAGKLASKAQKHRTDYSLEQWTRGIADLFYTAWNAKQNLLIADRALERRRKLLKTTQLKKRRGTAETPDLLQAESAFLLTESQKNQANQELNNHWRNLILSLKLPSQWISVDPRNVPMKLDEPIKLAESSCSDFRKRGVPATESALVRMNAALKEAGELKEEAEKAKVLPSLNLVGEFAFNGIDSEASETFSESTSTNNTGWTVGLQYSMPFSFNAEKAAYLKAYSESIQASAKYHSAKDDLRIEWMNDCSNLDRLKKDSKNALKAFKNQSRRADLESRRFNLGRVNLTNFIMAGDDAAEAERFYNQQRVLLRQVAWKVLQNDSKIPGIIRSMTEQYEKDN